MKNALVILAGGKGTRFHHEIPKQFHELGNKNMINIILSNIDSQLFNWIVLSINKSYRNAVKNYPEYFLGSIIMVDKNNDTFIIDGQQRITSLTLLFIYIHRILKSENLYFFLQHEFNILPLLFIQIIKNNYLT